MAVTDVITIGEGVKGNAQGRDAASVKASYSTRYLVKCDSATDAPNVVLAHFRATPSLPWSGRPFQLAGHFDVSAACDSVDADYVPNSQGMYHVVAKYSPVGSGGPQTSNPKVNGELTNNPILWHDEIDVSWTPLSRAVSKAKFHGFQDAKNPKERIESPHCKIDEETVPKNSAGVPYDPGIEEELYIKIIRISKNAAAYDDSAVSSKQGTVNESAVLINKPLYNFAALVPTQKGKLLIGASFAMVNGFGYWKQTVEVHINPIGWRQFLLDRGLTRAADEGDPDGRGGTISASDLPVEPSEGVPYQETLKDSEGYAITEPILLNGKGQPLKSSKGPFWGEWQTYIEASWSGINW